MPLTTDQTFLDLIKRSMRSAGLLQAGESPSAEDTDDVALILNAMLDAWAIDELYVYNHTVDSYALTANQQQYDVGPTATAPFNITRPARVEVANLKITSQSPNVEIPLEILDDDGWMRIPVKSITGTYPTKLYYSPSYPNGSLNFWPIPTSGLSVVLELWNQFSQFTDYTTAFSFPPGYFEAMYLNGAVRLSTPEYGIEVVPASLQRLANEARSRIQAVNASPPPQLLPDFGTQGVRQQQGYRNLYNPAPLWYR